MLMTHQITLVLNQQEKKVTPVKYYNMLKMVKMLPVTLNFSICHRVLLVYNSLF
jgi:hypothetical protein